MNKPSQLRAPHSALRIAVIGAGAWGTALALVAARSGQRVTLWAQRAEFADELQRARENKTYLAGFALPENLTVTNDLAFALSEAEIVLTVVPSHACRAVYEQMQPHLRDDAIIANASKGLEIDSQKRISEITQEVFGAARYVMLSGPSFAQEVAQDQPCALVAASRDAEAATAIQAALSSRRLRVYTNDDVTGVELGGALKNVMAMAVGAVNGLGLGYNSAAALVTRGLAEMTRLAVAAGGKAETLAGLAGLGDLVLTCFGELSRNRRVGIELGRGRTLKEILTDMHEVAEGVKTTRAAYVLAQRLNVEMPIVTGVYQMLYESKTPRELAEALMERPLKAE
jgi:glycerol-3-phosphate dehydrogenase (NAD(P)+)